MHAGRGRPRCASTWPERAMSSPSGAWLSRAKRRGARLLSVGPPLRRCTMSRTFVIPTAAALAALVTAACDRPIVAPERAAPGLTALAQASSQPQGAAAGGTLTEPSAYEGRICELRFPGTPSRTSEFFVIWNLGHGILDEP